MAARENELRGDGRFIALVAMLAENGMIALGKIVNPSTGEEEVSLEGAQGIIGLLEMIEAKTAGNLTSEEGNFLKAQLTNLRLNFVNEANRSSSGARRAEPVDDDDDDEDDDEAGEDGGAAGGAAHGGARLDGAGSGRPGAEPHVTGVGSGRAGKVVARDEEGRPTVVDKRASSRSDDE